MLHNTIEKYFGWRGRLLVLVSLFVGGPMVPAHAEGTPEKSVLDFTMKDFEGNNVPLAGFKGKVVLIVNVASECGYTPQYKGLEALYEKYKDQGLTVIAFPANNFGGQEPGTDAEIKAFCENTYHVTFKVFSKISVSGEDQHPLYRFLTSQETDPDFAGGVKWNFQKYLVDRRGKVIGKFMSAVEPMSKELTTAVETELNKP